MTGVSRGSFAHRGSLFEQWFHKILSRAVDPSEVALDLRSRVSNEIFLRMRIVWRVDMRDRIKRSMAA